MLLLCDWLQYKKAILFKIFMTTTTKKKALDDLLFARIREERHSLLLYEASLKEAALNEREIQKKEQQHYQEHHSKIKSDFKASLDKLTDKQQDLELDTQEALEAYKKAIGARIKLEREIHYTGQTMWI